MPTLAQTLLPGWLAGIMISGAIAAMMSTADSQLLVTTSTLSEDVYHKMFKQEVTPERLASFSRFATLIVGVLAFVLAIRSTDLVFAMVSFAWAGLSAAFGPALVLTLWWKRVSGYGVLAGMVGGALTVILWKTFGLDHTLTERVSGYFVALILVVAVSLMAPSPPPPEARVFQVSREGAPL
jgi:sodium/proline symporter